MPTPFNPGSVPIGLVLTFPQVNLVLEGLGKLPFERVEQTYNAIRGAAVQALQQAEAAHAAAEAQADLSLSPPAERAPPSPPADPQAGDASP